MTITNSTPNSNTSIDNNGSLLYSQDGPIIGYQASSTTDQMFSMVDVNTHDYNLYTDMSVQQAPPEDLKKEIKQLNEKIDKLEKLLKQFLQKETNTLEKIKNKYPKQNAIEDLEI